MRSSQHSYERTTLEMIADELGLSKPSLYYYVKSKEDILADLFQEIFQRILERVQRDVSPDLEPQVGCVAKNLRRMRRISNPSFLFSLDSHSKQAGDECHLLHAVSFFYATDLTFPEHIHGFISL